MSNFRFLHVADIHLDSPLTGLARYEGLPVDEVRANVGAGFVFPVCGSMPTMPGLGSSPAAERIDVDEHGQTVGLS